MAPGCRAAAMMDMSWLESRLMKPLLTTCSTLSLQRCATHCEQHAPAALEALEFEGGLGRDAAGQ